MKDEQKIRKEYKYSTSGVFKKRIPMIPPIVLDPVPIVPKIDLNTQIFFIPRVLSKQHDLIFKKTIQFDILYNFFVDGKIQRKLF